jgi:uncharacterized protein YodC (DUF2158 family)
MSNIVYISGKFAVGDIVRLRTGGGARMVIGKFNEQKEAVCYWVFRRDSFFAMAFPTVTLQKVGESKKGGRE